MYREKRRRRARRIFNMVVLAGEVQWSTAWEKGESYLLYLHSVGCDPNGKRQHNTGVHTSTAW
jgi:hypothetical protein